MPTSIARLSIGCLSAIAAAAAIGTLGAVPAAGSGARPAAARLTAAAELPAPGTTLWMSRYHGHFWGDNKPAAMAASPTGNMVFVTGSSPAQRSDDAYATVGYDTATGAQRWAARYHGPVYGDNQAVSVAVSPAGDMVFVSGSSPGDNTGSDYATVGYDAATGAQRWVQRYNGPSSGPDEAVAVAVSPSGDTVFVTGSSVATGSPYYSATIAYNAATGAQRWIRHDVLGSPSSLTVSPDGAMVFVTGGGITAYSAATGAILWHNRFGSGESYPYALAVGPGGRRVYAAGFVSADRTFEDYLTVAIDAATGAQIWSRQYDGPASTNDEAISVAVSPTADTVFVTGISVGKNVTADYTTLAYRTATGTGLWIKRFPGTGGLASALAVSPTANRVYVTGAGFTASRRYNFATVAYDPTTGAKLWGRWYSGRPGSAGGGATSMTVSPAGDRVYVTGMSGMAWNGSYVTIAYNG